MANPLFTEQCSFCGSSRDEIGFLVVGPEVSICSDCVDLAQDIIDEEMEGADENEDE